VLRCRGGRLAAAFTAHHAAIDERLATEIARRLDEMAHRRQLLRTLTGPERRPP
jgi:hypothetical protein